ncbi:MAG TPA: neutral zinc metallopeptidase [Candidatus Methylomirabilis sp.]|nr:neutral zinc metallopeptidase [Candidatus Methylomirabilis sp.]
MRWQMGRRSDNIEDRRGIGMGGVAIGGGIGTILLVVVALFLGVDPSVVLQGGGPQVSTAPPAVERRAPSPEEDRLKDFVAVVLADTEDTWTEIFRRMNREYKDPKLVLFSDVIQSSCGTAQSAAGPFYCPLDQKVYLDLSFFRDLRERFKAPGEFAQAYVIAHEVGHHVQTLLGISDKVRSMQSRANERDANALSVRLELQADCFAGVWANNANRSRQILEGGDIEKGLNAAAAIGDDRLQRQSRGYVVPDAFTHGSSAQRVRWFKSGLASGSLRQCDTFGAREL